MKYVKTYEEFDWHTFSTYAPLVGAAVGHLIAKYGGKYLINKRRKEYFKKSMRTQYGDDYLMKMRYIYFHTEEKDFPLFLRKVHDAKMDD